MCCWTHSNHFVAVEGTAQLPRYIEKQRPVQFHASPLSDVPRVQHDAPNDRVVEEVASDELDMDPRPIGVADAHLDRPGDALPTCDLGEKTWELVRILGV